MKLNHSIALGASPARGKTYNHPIGLKKQIQRIRDSVKRDGIFQCIDEVSLVIVWCTDGVSRQPPRLETSGDDNDDVEFTPQNKKK